MLDSIQIAEYEGVFRRKVCRYTTFTKLFTLVQLKRFLHALTERKLSRATHLVISTTCWPLVTVTSSASKLSKAVSKVKCSKVQ